MAKRVVSRKKNHVTAYRDDIFKVKCPVVYFIGTAANELVKVGYSARFRNRFIEISAASPVSLMALGVLRFSNVEAAKKAEIAIHKMLTGAGCHSHGEWFRLPISGIEALTAKFAEMGVQYADASGSMSSAVLDADRDERDIYSQPKSPRTSFTAAPSMTFI